MKLTQNRRRLFLRSLKAAGGLALVVVAWRTRILQVGAFLASAAIDRSLTRGNGNGPASREGDWSGEQQEARSSQYFLNQNTLISYHPEHQDFDPRMVLAGIDAAADLGVGWIRSDIRWCEILPDGYHADAKAISWYRNFLVAVSKRGLRNMVVLGSPPKMVLEQDLKQKHIFWEHFVETVSENLSEVCHSYQLMNEPNNPVYAFFDLSNAAEAIVNAASILRRAQGCQTAVNISTDLWGWRKYLNRLLELSAGAIDVVGLDHYPGTWTVAWDRNWSGVLSIAQSIASATPDSVWFNRRLAILETGYSTNAPFRDQAAQAKYFENLKYLLENLKRAQMPNGTALLGIYELSDGRNSVFLDPEASFGVLTNNLRPKLAFQAVKDLIGNINGGTNA